MTKMIERWFPCAEVSANSEKGWGSGNAEISLFSWFAKRPTAQAKAAVVCSLLPWPSEIAEQERLQSLVREAMTGRYAAWKRLRDEILKSNVEPPAILDPFSGRGMIPLEAARLCLPASGIEYSPVAVLASKLLVDYPFRNWKQETDLPFDTDAGDQPLYDDSRLVADVAKFLAEVGKRYTNSMEEFYPRPGSVRPWGYIWAATLPCSECGRRFPLSSSLELRKGGVRKGRRGAPDVHDPGASLRLVPDHATGRFEALVVPGPPTSAPTLRTAAAKDGGKSMGKSAVCLFCSNVHSTAQHRRMSSERLGEDVILAVVLEDRSIRSATDEDRDAAAQAASVLQAERPFGNLPATPDERIAPGNGSVIQPSLYGASTFGELMCDRQTLSFIRLCRIIDDLFGELMSAGVSLLYAQALAGYAAATLVRKLRYSTRGAWFRARDSGSVEVAGIFVNESSISFSYDFFETACYDGAASWNSMAEGTVSSLKRLMPDETGSPGDVERGTATSLPYRESKFDAVVTDPPYDQMIAYADTSDIYFVWIRRALVRAFPEMTMTADPYGAQDKASEIIVKKFRAKKEGLTDHRTQTFYDAQMRLAFNEMNRVVKPDGVVTIVFGHGDPEVWQRLLDSIEGASLVMTGSWPARTESGGQKGVANIATTLTMACRPAPSGRPQGRKGAVEAEIKSEIRNRYPDWERWGLAPADMLMAAAGPAMEVVGRYSEVLDARGQPVDIYTFLPLARAAVQDAMAVEVDHHPLETFDARTRFALWWVRLYGRQAQAKSELRWQSLASSMDIADVRDLIPEADKGVAFTSSRLFKKHITADAVVIDVVLALAAASEDGLASMGEVLAMSGRSADDAYLWAAVKFLADRLPDSDPDAIALTRVLRTRDGISNAAQAIVTTDVARQRDQQRDDAQLRLL